MPVSKVIVGCMALVGVALGLSSFYWQSAPQVLSTQEIKLLGASVFPPGERLKYRVHYGFLNAGEAELSVGGSIREQNGRPCYQVEVSGRSVGAFNRLVKIRNTWGAYLDTALLKPQRAYRDISENRYRLEEQDYFDYKNRTLLVKVKERKDTTFRIPPVIFDIVSGYYFLRQVDYNRMTEGTVLVLDAFFDNQQYKFKVRYTGHETIKTKYGKIRCIVISPIMPDNSFFDGENSIRLWMSDDANRVPVKVSAELFVGSVDLDITNYSGTRTPLMSN